MYIYIVRVVVPSTYVLFAIQFILGSSHAHTHGTLSYEYRYSDTMGTADTLLNNSH